MYRVSPILLSFIPNILQTLHSAKSSSKIFTQNFENKKIWIFSFLTPMVYPLPPYIQHLRGRIR